MKRIFFTSVLFIALALNSFAYDAIGHRTVADIAYNNLSLKAQQQVDKLLGKHGIIYFATWADDMRNDSSYAYSYNWHFQNLADSLTTRDLQKLWENPLNEGEHLFYAIQKMVERLKTDKSDVEALKFLVHFVGDLHQPFHLGRAEDRGGNDIQTKWFGQNIKVHQLWDRELIEHQSYSYSEYSRYLQDKFEKQQNAFKKVNMLQSIEAVYNLRKELYEYDYSKMRYYEYNFKYKDKLDEMLYRGGTQLARILNEIYK